MIIVNINLPLYRYRFNPPPPIPRTHTNNSNLIQLQLQSIDGLYELSISINLSVRTLDRDTLAGILLANCKVHISYKLLDYFN